MALFKEGCGHPTEWNLRVVYNGTRYTYCLGCIVEKLGLDNLEAYDNPFIKTKTLAKVDFDKDGKPEVKDIVVSKKVAKKVFPEE